MILDTQRSTRERHQQAFRTRRFSARSIKDYCIRPELTTNCKYPLCISQKIYLFEIHVARLVTLARDACGGESYFGEEGNKVNRLRDTERVALRGFGHFSLAGISRRTLYYKAKVRDLLARLSLLLRVSALVPRPP